MKNKREQTTGIEPMALITSAIANGGELMKPYLIDSVVSSDGETVKTTEPESYKRLMVSSKKAASFATRFSGFGQCRHALFAYGLDVIQYH